MFHLSQKTLLRAEALCWLVWSYAGTKQGNTVLALLGSVCNSQHFFGISANNRRILEMTHQCELNLLKFNWGRELQKFWSFPIYLSIRECEAFMNRKNVTVGVYVGRTKAFFLSFLRCSLLMWGLSRYFAHCLISFKWLLRPHRSRLSDRITISWL